MKTTIRLTLFFSIALFIASCGGKDEKAAQAKEKMQKRVKERRGN